jgi:hypothetical protein
MSANAIGCNSSVDHQEHILLPYQLAKVHSGFLSYASPNHAVVSPVIRIWGTISGLRYDLYTQHHRYRNFKQDLVTPLSDLLYSPIYLSFVSYLCRAENTYHISEFLEQRNISFTKEFLATTTPTKPQQLNYVGLLTGSSNEPHMHSMICSTDLSMPHNLLNAYRSKILRLKDKLETYLGKLMLITWTYLLVCRLFMNLFRVNSGICICR